MKKIKDLLAALLCYSISLFAVLFGSYLVYEKVFLSLQTGVTEERAGLLERASDPFFFWLWVSLYGLVGSIISVGGVCLFIWIVRIGREQD